MTATRYAVKVNLLCYSAFMTTPEGNRIRFFRTLAAANREIVRRGWLHGTEYRSDPNSPVTAYVVEMKEDDRIRTEEER